MTNSSTTPLSKKVLASARVGDTVIRRTGPEEYKAWVVGQLYEGLIGVGDTPMEAHRKLNLKFWLEHAKQAEEVRLREKQVAREIRERRRKDGDIFWWWPFK